MDIKCPEQSPTPQGASQVETIPEPVPPTTLAEPAKNEPEKPQNPTPSDHSFPESEPENEELSDDSDDSESGKGSGRAKGGKKKKSRYSTFTRKLWNDEEDEAILNLVKTYGIRRWTLISKKLQECYHIHGRSGKQCRER